MKLRDETLRIIAEFAARFGFISRDIFFEYLSPYRRSQSFKVWKLFINNGWLVPFDQSQHSCYLSKKARQKLVASAVPAASMMTIAHDTLAAQFLLELENRQLVSRYWTEPELSMMSTGIYSLLGSKHGDKIPDLVVDLNGAYGNMRLALEIERTVKSRERYSVAALSYLGMKNIDLVIFGCRFEAATRQIASAFQGELFVKERKNPALFSTAKFGTARLSAPVRYNDRDYSMREFLSKALQFEVPSEFRKSADDSRTGVRTSPRTEADAA